MRDDYRYRCNVVDSPHVPPNSNFAGERAGGHVRRLCVGALYDIGEPGPSGLNRTSAVQQEVSRLFRPTSRSWTPDEAPRQSGLVRRPGQKGMQIVYAVFQLLP